MTLQFLCANNNREVREKRIDVRFKEYRGSHHLYEMGQTSCRMQGPLLPSIGIDLPSYLRGSRMEKKTHWKPILGQSAPYWPMLELLPSNPQTRKVMPRRVLSIRVSTSINITDSISGQAAPKGEEKNPERKVHVLPLSLQDVKTGSCWRLNTLGFQGLHLLVGNPKERKARKVDVPYTLVLPCFCVTVYF